MTQQTTQEKQPRPSQASHYVQHSADVLIYTVTLAHRLNTAPTLLALAACRLFINALHASQINRRATVEEAAAVLDLVRQNIKSAKRHPGPKPRKKPQEPRPIDVREAFSLACESGALEDFDGGIDHFEAVARAFSYLKAYRMVVEWWPAPEVTLDDAAEFVALLRTSQ
jgi:hypothetical protein